MPMEPAHWDNRMSRIMGAFIGSPGRGDAPLLLLVNARDMDASFTLPPGHWVAELDSTAADGRSTWKADSPCGLCASNFLLPSRSVVLLRDTVPE